MKSVSIFLAMLFAASSSNTGHAWAVADVGLPAPDMTVVSGMASPRAAPAPSIAGGGSESVSVSEAREMEGWLQQRLLAPVPSGDARMGNALDLDGGRLFMAAYAETVDGVPFNGSVYVAERQGGEWQIVEQIVPASDQARMLFGSSLDADGQYLAVGALALGLAFVFEEQDGQWRQVARLESPTGLADGYGQAIALSGDHLLVGAPSHGASGGPSIGGAVHVYRRTGTDWLLSQMITASEPFDSDQFGGTVTMHGDLALVSASGVRRGLGGADIYPAAYLFRFDEQLDQWQQIELLRTVDYEIAEHFGKGLDLNDDVIVIGAPGYSGAGGAVQGAAYVFQRNGAGAWAESQRLVASDAQSNEGFGQDVAITEDGRSLFVGSVNSFTSAGPQMGAGFVFHGIDGLWREAAKVFPADPAPNTYFAGWAVATDGADFVLGALATTLDYLYQGAVFVYREDDRIFVDGFESAPTAQ